jgi:hypothetical protein
MLDVDKVVKIAQIATPILALAGTIIGALLAHWFARKIANYQTSLSKDMTNYQTGLSKDIAIYQTDLSKGLENHKRDISRELDITRRYLESQFHLYCELWSSLCDLRITGNNLWEQVSEANARLFYKQLQQTENQIIKSSLLIEDQHYESLKRLIKDFHEFNDGKGRLRDIVRNHHPLPEHDRDRMLERIRQATEMNREIKDRYSQLLIEIECSFKRQIRGA